MLKGNNKVEVMQKLIDQLKQNNKELYKENARLKAELRKQQLLINEVTKYKKEHDKVLASLTVAKDKYDTALSLLTKERKKYKEEMNNFLENY